MQKDWYRLVSDLTRTFQIQQLMLKFSGFHRVVVSTRYFLSPSRASQRPQHRCSPRIAPHASRSLDSAPSLPLEPTSSLDRPCLAAPPAGPATPSPSSPQPAFPRAALGRQATSSPCSSPRRAHAWPQLCTSPAPAPVLPRTAPSRRTPPRPLRPAWPFLTRISTPRSHIHAPAARAPGHDASTSRETCWPPPARHPPLASAETG
jgi:hypothetical protein